MKHEGKHDTDSSAPRQQPGRAFRHLLDGPGLRKFMMSSLDAIPQSVQRATMPFWAALAYGLVPEARKIVERNLTQVLGPASSLESHRRTYRLFVNYAQAIANLYVLHLGQELPVDPEFQGYDNLREILREQRGAIAVTGHIGFWQITPFICARRSWFPAMTMAMAEEPNQKLRAVEDQLRAKFRIVYTTTSPFASIQLANILRKGEFVGMQMDRHLGGSHVMVPFCGKPAPFPLGPATLGRATRCPILPVFVTASPDRRRCTFRVEEPIEVAHTRDRDTDVYEATAKTVAIYQRYVQTYPEQWFNFHDFWQAPAPPAPGTPTVARAARR